PDELLPKAAYQIEVTADRDGVISKVDAEDLGLAAIMLGAGRETIESELDLAAGLMLHKKISDKVEKGETIVTIHSNKKEVDDSVQRIKDNINISDEAEHLTLIHEIIH